MIMTKNNLNEIAREKAVKFVEAKKMVEAFEETEELSEGDVAKQDMEMI